MPPATGLFSFRKTADQLRDEGEAASKSGEWFELAETAMQVSIVLLSIALVARSTAIVSGAAGLALVGVIIAAATAMGAP